MRSAIGVASGSPFVANTVGVPAVGGALTPPALDLNFKHNDALDPRITFTRASSGTRVNPSGLIESLGNDVPRFDYDPVTLSARGLLIEEQRTNSLRNSEAGGASAGTPGTLPTNWTESHLAAGLTRQIVSIGSSGGLNYVDFRISGTAGDATGWQIEFEAYTFVNAVSGENWALSFYCYLLAGSVVGVSNFNCRIVEGNPGYLADSLASFTPGSTSSLIQARRTCQRTLNNVSTTKVRGALFIAIANGQTVDFTLRVAAPQLEGNAAIFSTSYIPTTAAAATRAADVARMTGTNFSDWFNATEGTFVVQGDLRGPAGVLPTLISADNGTAAERIQLRASIDLLQLNFSCTTGSVNQANLSGGTFVAGSLMKIASAYKVNDFSASFNGGAAVVDTVGTVAAPNQMQIGIGPNSVATNGHIQRLTYYNKRLPDATLQALST